MKVKQKQIILVLAVVALIGLTGYFTLFSVFSSGSRYTAPDGYYATLLSTQGGRTDNCFYDRMICPETGYQYCHAEVLFPITADNEDISPGEVWRAGGCMGCVCNLFGINPGQSPNPPIVSPPMPPGTLPNPDAERCHGGGFYHSTDTIPSGVTCNSIYHQGVSCLRCVGITEGCMVQGATNYNSNANVACQYSNPGNWCCQYGSGNGNNTAPPSNPFGINADWNLILILIAIIIIVLIVAGAAVAVGRN
jgi:hypothetical protein